jgi:hypothetical protein
LFVVLIVMNLAITFECSKLTETIKAKRNKKAVGSGPIWPTLQIPYAFSNIIEFDFNARSLIDKTLEQVSQSLMINGNQCIQFVPRKNEKDYILFADRGDCSSSIGFQPGINTISLAKQCIHPGTIIHEVLHR